MVFSTDQSPRLFRRSLRGVWFRGLIVLLVGSTAVSVYAQNLVPAVDADGEAAMFERINALRAEQELPALQRHEGLDAAGAGA